MDTAGPAQCMAANDPAFRYWHQHVGRRIAVYFTPELEKVNIYSGLGRYKEVTVGHINSIWRWTCPRRQYVKVGNH